MATMAYHLQKDPADASPFQFRRVAQFSAVAALLMTLSGCQSITGSPTLSQVRVVDASPDAPAFDVYQGSSVLAYNLGFQFRTSYVPVPPGTYPISVDTAGTRQQLISASGTFLNNAQYTVLVGSYAATLQELVLTDQSQPAPSGSVSVRFLDQSLKTGAVDLYMVPSGSTVSTAVPVATDVAFNANSGYVNIPAGSYTLVIVPTGTKSPASTSSLYTGPTVAYPGACARTLVLVDAKVTNVPSLNVVTLNDFDLTDEGS